MAVRPSEYSEYELQALLDGLEARFTQQLGWVASLARAAAGIDLEDEEGPDRALALARGRITSLVAQIEAISETLHDITSLEAERQKRFEADS